MQAAVWTIKSQNYLFLLLYLASHTQSADRWFYDLDKFFILNCETSFWVPALPPPCPIALD